MGHSALTLDIMIRGKSCQEDGQSYSSGRKSRGCLENRREPNSGGASGVLCPRLAAAPATPQGGASDVLTSVGRAVSEIGGECNGPPRGGSSGANMPVRHNSQGWASRLSRIPRVDTLLLGRCEFIWDTHVPVLTFEYLIDFQNTPPAGKADNLI